jgi:hypothetical protein
MKYILIASLALLACQQKQDPKVPVLPSDDMKGSVHDFMTEYGNLVATGNYDSIPLLYDTLGAITIGNNRMVFEPMDSLKARYHSFGNAKINFRWDSMDVQILDSTIALVTSLFYWNQPPSKDTAKVFYTGVLVKQRGKWKIKHEHESPDLSKERKN